MDIEVLGACRVMQTGKSVVPSAVKPRKVLAVLALNPDRPVSVGMLVEEVWGETPPPSVATTLQTYILQLRNLITSAIGGPSPDLPLGAKSVLVTQPGGYLLDTQGGSVDVREYERLSGGGHRALEKGDYEAAADLFRKALALWRGPALADVECGRVLDVEVTRLEESRMGILCRRIEADLLLGRHHEIIGELFGLAARHPLHEGIHLQLMLALYRAGRRTTALEVYQRLRDVLAGELGLDPSYELQSLQGALLDSSSELRLDQPLSLFRVRAPGRY
ncbi:DNA-binding transcriptional activator of the SARP family [Streptomyces sp. DI166]|nr:DNA-binding transcriptional activator of the SARP family [Streptomyces sp. DI166]